MRESIVAYLVKWCLLGVSFSSFSHLNEGESNRTQMQLGQMKKCGDILSIQGFEFSLVESMCIHFSLSQKHGRGCPAPTNTRRQRLMQSSPPRRSRRCKKYWKQSRRTMSRRTIPSHRSRHYQVPR